MDRVGWNRKLRSSFLSSSGSRYEENTTLIHIQLALIFGWEYCNVQAGSPNMLSPFCSALFILCIPTKSISFTIAHLTAVPANLCPATFPEIFRLARRPPRRRSASSSRYHCRLLLLHLRHLSVPLFGKFDQVVPLLFHLSLRSVTRFHLLPSCEDLHQVGFVKYTRAWHDYQVQFLHGLLYFLFCHFRFKGTGSNPSRVPNFFALLLFLKLVFMKIPSSFQSSDDLYFW